MIYKNRGISIIEALVTLCVFAAMLIMAYPSYINYQTKIRRVDGQNALLDLAEHMESYYAKYYTYKGATTPSATRESIKVSKFSPQSWYQLTISSDEDSYILIAIPRGVQAQNDKLCGTLSLDSNGEKRFTGAGSETECW